MIRSVLLAAASSLVLASVAIAADLPSTKGPPVYAPPPPPVFSWSGFYIGGQVGYEWGRSDPGVYAIDNSTLTSAEPSYSDAGVVGGVHLGYNYQFSQFLIGVEGDANGSSYSGSGLSNSGAHRLATRIPFDGSFRGRVGFVWDRVLIYGTGGVAFADIHNSVTTVFGFPGPGTVDSGDFGRVGWTAGGGIEYAIDPNWSIRAEYRYTDYGTTSLALNNTGFGPFQFNHSHERDNRVQVGFSYRFGEPPPPAPPIVTKY